MLLYTLEILLSDLICRAKMKEKSIVQDNKHLDTCRMFAGLSEDRLFNAAVMSLMSRSWILIPLITEKFLSCLHII